MATSATNSPLELLDQQTKLFASIQRSLENLDGQIKRLPLSSVEETLQASTKYEYSMVQIPATLIVSEAQYVGNEAAQYLQKLVNGGASNGWEFYRVDTIGIAIRPGCLASLLGRGSNNNSI